MAARPKIDIRGTYRNHGPLFPDTRNGLGYGLSIPSGRHNPKGAQDNFPYLDPDLYDEDVDDEELDDIESQFLTKLNKNVFATDSLAPLSTDPFYFVAGNTKMSEATGVARNSIVPIPGLYRGGVSGPAVGGYSTATAYTSQPYKRTGSKQGYFGPPPPPATPKGYELVTFNLGDLLDNDELAMAKFKALRDYIDTLADEAE
jgi:hypothetical protein